MKSAPALLRAALVARGAFAARASSTYSQQPPPPAYPPYGQAGEPGAPGAPGQAGQTPQASGAPGQDYCFTLSTGQTTTSICTVGFGGCERQRQSAQTDGQETTECVPWAPVACFQLAGDPAPTARFCAANLEDCEVWRGVDQQQNGRTGDTCSWKQ
jgi:hypothetical protein